MYLELGEFRMVFTLGRRSDARLLLPAHYPRPLGHPLKMKPCAYLINLVHYNWAIEPNSFEREL